MQAGETLALQVLAVNTGDRGRAGVIEAGDWEAGSYYWVAEIYDLENNLVARTDQVSPVDAVKGGEVAAISLPFKVPETMAGRRLYRVFLVKDAQTLLVSDYRPFQVVEKAVAPPPEVTDYRLEGNITVSYKNNSRYKWKDHSAATTLNTVGKIKDCSYLLNAYLLHEPGNVFDPFIILGSFYAPWGTIYAGDVSPSLGPISVNGQAMRGAVLEQKRGSNDWSVLGGQIIESQPGNRTTNGRYARSLYALKYGREMPGRVKLNLNYFLSSDETGSLSNDPNSSDFRGPTLNPRKNRGYGLDLLWTPARRLSIILAYQSNAYSYEGGDWKDTAYRGEVKFDRQYFKTRAYLQRAGPKFVAFASPSVVGDRLTYDFSFGVYPASWYNFSMSYNQNKNNLESNPNITTITQGLMGTSHNFQFPTRTGLGLSYTINTTKSQPSTMDSQTTTMGANLSQSVGRHSGSLSMQTSQFKDKSATGLNLDTQTLSFSVNIGLPKKCSSSFGVTRSETRDKLEGSKRTSMTASPSLSVPFKPGLTGQFWGNYSIVQNTSPTFPSDTATMSFNSELTKMWSQNTAVTWGLGYNSFQDKKTTSASHTELLFNSRISYSF
ncbi:MAG: hypothetical protein WC728_09135 [Elusimicrobiota bacterium]